jgi:hypothetical protein
MTKISDYEDHLIAPLLPEQEAIAA